MTKTSFITGLLLYLGAIASKIFINDSYGTATRLMIIGLLLGSFFLFLTYLDKERPKK